MEVLITIIICIVLIWIICFVFAFFNPKLDTLIVDNKKRYILWYTGTEDGTVIRKYLILF